jgi:hypothetical protein
MLFRNALQKISRIAQKIAFGNIGTSKMEINIHSFHSRLPSLLRAVSNAHFVAIDLELSGIPSHQSNKPRVTGNHHSGKATLQERYEETKQAAETYQVLQLGITCVEEDKDKGTPIGRDKISRWPILIWRRCLHCITVQFLREPCP